VVALCAFQGIQICKRHEGNKKKTAERLNLARGTVRKFWNMSEAEDDATRFGRKYSPPLR